MKYLVLILYSVLFSTIFFMGMAFFVFNHTIIDMSKLENYNPGKPSILLDNNGAEWGRFQIDKRELITYEKLPDHLIKAFIATEDREFFNHSGLSFKGMIRSILINIIKGKRAQGASTITQQLVRLLFLDAKKNFSRKIKEQIYSLIVENQFSKEYILQTYLNHVYFGAGIYGVQAACNRFWNKNVSEISIAQAAILAGIVRSPNHYCPLYNPDYILSRRNIILKLMLDLNFIKQSDYDAALNEPVIDKDNLCEDALIAPHLKENIRLYLEDLYGKKRLYSGGLKIYTTININSQKTAQDIFDNYLKQFKKNIAEDVDGAFISVDTKTGQIRTLIGGYDFKESKFNRAFTAQRQIGSIFKPLIYSQALLSGQTFKDIGTDDEFELADNNTIWKPRNHYRDFLGPITLAHALSISNNIITIKLFLEHTQSTLDLAEQVGFLRPNYAYPSLALGCLDSNLETVVGMMNIFANHGKYCKPYFIKYIKDEWGNKIYSYKPKYSQVLPAPVSDQVAKIMTLLVNRAKAREPQKWFDFEAFGKTGTTNDARTCWFAGSTPDITTSIYIGRDNNLPLGENVYASKTVMQIWRAFNNAIGSTKKKFNYDQSLKSVIINKVTGEECSKKDSSAIEILIPK